MAAADLAAAGRLDFEEPDPERFPALGLGFRAAAAGGTMGAVLNAANEVAVAAFLERRMRFTDIPRVVAEVMDHHEPTAEPTPAEILESDRWARQEADAWLACSR